MTLALGAVSAVLVLAWIRRSPPESRRFEVEPRRGGVLLETGQYDPQAPARRHFRENLWLRAIIHVALSTRLVSEYWLPFAIAACPPIYMLIAMIRA